LASANTASQSFKGAHCWHLESETRKSDGFSRASRWRYLKLQLIANLKYAERQGRPKKGGKSYPLKKRFFKWVKVAHLKRWVKLEELYAERQGGNRRSDDFQVRQTVTLEKGRTRALVAGGEKQRVSYFFPCAVIKLMTTESFPSIKKVEPVTVADKEKQGVSYFL